MKNGKENGNRRDYRVYIEYLMFSYNVGVTSLKHTMRDLDPEHAIGQSRCNLSTSGPGVSIMQTWIPSKQTIFKTRLSGVFSLDL